MAVFSVLITGASGYIGGTILNALLKTNETWVKELKITALARTEAQITKLSELGIEAVHLKSFDDVETLKSVAKNHDIVIHAGAGWHVASAVALLEGQGARRAKHEKELHYFQISGTSNLSDRRHSGTYYEDNVFSDKLDIFSYEKYRESIEPYLQRTTDIAVVETGVRVGIKTYIIMAPTIFGLGTGLFNRYSIQIPSMIASAVRSRQVGVIGEGKTKWNHVHVEDVASLHTTMLSHILAGKDIPSGYKGIYFVESGEHTHYELSRNLAEALHQLGIIPSSDVRNFTLQEAGAAWAMGDPRRAELAFGSNARTRADLGRELGWKPTKDYLWETTLTTEVTEMQRNPPPQREIPKVLLAKH